MQVSSNLFYQSINSNYRSNCDKNIGDILRQHYDRPYFLPITAENEKTDWIFMGSPGYGAPMHVNYFKMPNKYLNKY